MNKEEKSLLDELFAAAGLSDQAAEKHTKNEKTSEKSKKDEILEEISRDKEKLEEKTEETKEFEEISKKEAVIKEIVEDQKTAEVKPVNEQAAKDIDEMERVIEEILQGKTKKKKQDSEKDTKQQSPAQPEQDTAKEDHATKKKDIKFLVIYTVVFVVVISSLIAGSYVITSRIHRQMAQSNENLNTSQSTLRNILDQNESLKQENTQYELENKELVEANEDVITLLESAGDMVEHDSYLTAAQNAYISGDEARAQKILNGIEEERLSPPAKEYYDLLKEKLES